jgi:hypothetical protein
MNEKSKSALPSPRTVFAPSLGALLILWIFLSMMQGRWTSTDTLMTSVLIPNVIEGNGIDLNAVKIIRERSPEYYFETASGVLSSIYPIGMTMVSLPVQLPLWLGAKAVDRELRVDSPQFSRTRFLVEKVSASALVAATIYLFMLILRHLIGEWYASLAVILYTIGSSALSMLTQSLWQHTGVNLCATICIFFLLRTKARSSRFETPLFFLTLGTMLAIRPTTFLIVVPAAVAYGVMKRPSSAAALAYVLLGMTPAIVWNLLVFQHPLGGYALVYQKVVSTDLGALLKRVMLILFSPHRGLLVYNPLLIGAVIAPLHLSRFNEIERRIIVISLLVASVYLFFCATNPTWHGGTSFGPRYMLDCLTVLAVPSAIFYAHTLPQSSHGFKVLCVVLALFSICIHLFGVFGGAQGSSGEVLYHEILNPRDYR